MSVLASKRKESKFEVYSSLRTMRKAVTDLLLRDFSFNEEKSEQRINKLFSDKILNEVPDENGNISKERKSYERILKRNQGFEDWFLVHQRNAIINCLQNITRKVYMANSIYPTCREEYTQRRIFQDEAIGLLFSLLQELEYSIETLPVDADVYLNVSNMVQKEINLVRQWRKSDAKNNKQWVDSVSSTNFSNVNNNGNANNNGASNSNGVRPDFDNAIK